MALGERLFGDLGRDGFKLGGELPEPAVGVEVAAELPGVFILEGAGDGRAVYPPGPGPARPQPRPQLRWPTDRRGPPHLYRIWCGQSGHLVTGSVPNPV